VGHSEPGDRGAARTATGVLSRRWKPGAVRPEAVVPAGRQRSGRRHSCNHAALAVLEGGGNETLLRRAHQDADRAVELVHLGCRRAPSAPSTSSASARSRSRSSGPLGAATGVIRTISQSAPEVDHAPAGIVAAAKPSADSTVVDVAALVVLVDRRRKRGARRRPDREVGRGNGALFPEESCSSPGQRVGAGGKRAGAEVDLGCRSRSAPLFAPPSSVTLSGVAGSLVTSPIAFTELTVVPSAGVEETNARARCCPPGSS